MTPMGSQVLIDHSRAMEITPLSLSEYSVAYIMQTRESWLTWQELQLYNHIDKLLLD